MSRIPMWLVGVAVVTVAGAGALVVSLQGDDLAGGAPGAGTATDGVAALFGSVDPTGAVR